MEHLTPLIAVHATLALVALPLGAYQLFGGTKGSPAHRFVGRVWVALMLAVALTSYGIRGINGDSFSGLHVLSTVTLVTVTLGLVNARRGRISAHRGNMTGSWLGLVGAFAFAAAIPDRVVPQFVMTRPPGALAFAVAVALTTVAIVALGHRLTPSPPRQS